MPFFADAVATALSTSAPASWMMTLTVGSPMSPSHPTMHTPSATSADANAIASILSCSRRRRRIIVTNDKPVSYANQPRTCVTGIVTTMTPGRAKRRALSARRHLWVDLLKCLVSSRGMGARPWRGRRASLRRVLDAESRAGACMCLLRATREDRGHHENEPSLRGFSTSCRSEFSVDGGMTSALAKKRPARFRLKSRRKRRIPADT